MNELEKYIFDIWNEYLVETDFETDMSSLTYLCDCLTRSYYRVKLPEVHKQNRNVYYLAIGRLLHQWLCSRLAIKLGGQTEVLLSYETDHFVIKGRADIMTNDYIVELKTSGRLPEKPYESHVEQLNAYLAMSDKPYGYIVYVSRIDGSVKVFEHVIDNYMWNRTLEKAKVFRKACELNEPPEPYKSKQWLMKACKYCEYKSICVYKVIDVCKLSDFETEVMNNGNSF